MRACILKVLSHSHIVVQCVLGPLWIKYVACIAQSAFSNTIRPRTHHFYHWRYILHPVQGVEYPEDVYPAFRRLLNESLNQIVRISCITHSIHSTDKHLKEDIWNGLSKLCQTLPGVFTQEAHAYTK